MTPNDHGSKESHESRPAAASGGFGDKLRGGVEVVHGAGEYIRGTALGTLDSMTNGGTKHHEIAQRGREEVQRGIAKIQGIASAPPTPITGGGGDGSQQGYSTDADSSGYRNDSKAGNGYNAQPSPHQEDHAYGYAQSGSADQASPPYQPPQTHQSAPDYAYGADNKSGYEAPTNATPVEQHADGEAVPGGPGGFRRRHVDPQGQTPTPAQGGSGPGYQEDYESFVGRK